MNIRVLVIADDALARAGLAMLLGGQTNLFVVGQIGNVAELDDAVPLYRPDAIVWDAGTRAPERAMKSQQVAQGQSFARGEPLKVLHTSALHVGI